ncbi:MAG: site-2 protease family protein [Candidatus Aenigmarchaeota archaeon]|nr:site-2 protease family protein [Candidatus Aenigmarchaeota archaeon]
MQYFSKEEVKDIIISILVVALIFSYNLRDPKQTFLFFPYYLVIVVLSFLFHELAHKSVARKFGCISFYKMWTMGLLLSLVLMLIGVRIIIPGAVVIYPFTFGRWGFKRIRLSAQEIGIISVSGILVNIFIAAISRPFIGSFLVHNFDFFFALSYINSFLAFFNLLPIPPLDGNKIMIWKPWLWFFLIAIAASLLFSFIF